MGGKSLSSFVALLRGINVGGKNILPMAELAKVFAGCGCSDVETYIQSGNVVFRASQPQGVLSQRLSAAIHDRLGLNVPVVIRSREDFLDVAQEHPFERKASELKMLHVLFVADSPTAEQVASLDPERSPGDEFTVIGDQVFVFLGSGAAKSKLSNAYFDSRLGSVGTMRNWRTVGKIAAMLSAPAT